MMRAGLRSLAERLSRGRVLRRRLPAAHGGHRLFVTPDSALKLWRRDLGQVEPELLALAGQLVSPADRVWDLGANVGLFAFAAAFHAGPAGAVVAIEADDFLCGLLRRSAADAPPAYAPVTVLHAAVADRVGLASFVIARRGRAASHLATVPGSSQAGGERETRKVTTWTLDALIRELPAPTLVKIDVEGAELACLRGAERLLAEVRPRLFVEVTEENSPAVSEIFERHGYLLFDAAGCTAGDWGAPVTRAPWGTLALPGELAGGS